MLEHIALVGDGTQSKTLRALFKKTIISISQRENNANKTGLSPRDINGIKLDFWKREVLLNQIRTEQIYSIK